MAMNNARTSFQGRSLSRDILVSVLLSDLSINSMIGFLPYHTSWLLLMEETTQEYAVNREPVPSPPCDATHSSSELLGDLSGMRREREQRNSLGDPSTFPHISWETLAKLLAHSEPLLLQLWNVDNNIYFLAGF